MAMSDFSLEIFQELVLLSVAKGVIVEKERLKIYCLDLKDYDTAEVIQAIRKLRRTSVYFPQISEIIDMVVTGGQKPEDIGTMIANEIMECAFKFGNNRWDEAKKTLGEKWIIVEKFGRWADICHAQITAHQAIRAQLRELATVFVKQAKSNARGGLKIAIPSFTIDSQLKLPGKNN